MFSTQVLKKYPNELIKIMKNGEKMVFDHDTLFLKKL